MCSCLQRSSSFLGSLLFFDLFVCLFWVCCFVLFGLFLSCGFVVVWFALLWFGLDVWLLVCLVGWNWMPGCWVVWFFGGLVGLCLFVCLSVCLFVCLSVCGLSLCLFVWVSVSVSVCLVFGFQ